MNPSKIILTASSLFLGLLGLACSFLPQEILNELDVTESVVTVLILQLLSGLLIGTAALNWMQKDALIGGIYHRPLTMTNLILFGIGSIALIKAFFVVASIYIQGLSVLYTVFAISYLYLAFTHPKSKK